MKTIILILLASVINGLGAHSQRVMHLPVTNERIISSKKIEYLNIEEGWAREKNVWYFHGNQIMVTPAIYTLIETIDSTFTSNEEKSKFRMEIREESSGNYKTSEEGWNWNGGVWTFKEDTVHSYPPSFTREAKVTRTMVDNENHARVQRDEIEEFYQIEDENWTWDLNQGCWLYDNNHTHGLPKYKIIKSRAVTHTGNVIQ